MKDFACTNCGAKVHFENCRCLTCGLDLGFDASSCRLVALRPLSVGADTYEAVGGAPAIPVRYCANAAHGVCNWLAPADSGTGLCPACSLNRTIPNLSEPGSLAAWGQLEAAKKRMVYSLQRFGLPLSDPDVGRLTFDFARNTTTGHFAGVITIDIMEADAVERERQKQFFGEPYRSLLGHLRHESGHFYWHLLVEKMGRLDEFRSRFGDERADYGEALAHHHAEGARSDWQWQFLSSYASSHPWEDWAETWAHYLHMVDAVDTAEAVGLEPRSAGLILGAIWPFKSYDVYREESFQSLRDRWVPLTVAMNSLSRSMGHPDFYPFVISGPALDKLAFVHNVVRTRRT